MKNKGWSEISMGQRGAVMVEAVFVFPIVLFILMLIIYLGNIYYQKARVNELVNRYAIEGAQAVADPFMDKIKTAMDEGKSLSTDCRSGTLNLQPYRYVTGTLGLGYIKKLEGDMSDEIKAKLEDNSSTLFDSVKVKNITTDNEKICKYKPGFLSSSFVVQVNYEITYPFYWFGGNSVSVVKCSARSECAVNDMDEFIRNIDMVVDLLQGTKFGNKVEEWFSKMNGFIKKFSEWGS